MSDPMRTTKDKPRTKLDRWGSMKWKGSQEPISWSCAEPRVLQDAIVGATEDGAAVLLSKTSDGGALALQILSGSERYKYYLADSVEVDDLLRMMAPDKMS